MTVSDLMYRALRLSGVLRAAGRGASALELADAMAAANSLLDSWATEKLLVYATQITDYALNSGQGTYTYGPGATDWDTTPYPRPVRIERASTISLMNANQPMELPIAIWDDDDWQHIPVKNVSSPYIQGVYFQKVFPIGNVYVWPLPSVSINFCRLYTWGQLPQFSSLTQILELAPGYRRALEYGIAVECFPLFQHSSGTSLDPNVLREAVDAKAAVKRLNLKVGELRVDGALVPGAGGRYMVWSDTFRQ